MLPHWVRNRGRARAATLRMPYTDTGTVVSATIASSGEMRNIIPATPISRSTEVSIWLIVCCRLWARLSRSLVTRLSRSPRACWSMWRRVRAWTLASAWARSRCMRRCTTPAIIHAVMIESHGRHDVEADGEHQHLVEAAEVDARRAPEPVDDHVGAPAEHPRPEDVEEGADDGGEEDEHEDRALGPEEGPEPTDGQAELVGALGGHAGRVPAPRRWRSRAR